MTSTSSAPAAQTMSVKPVVLSAPVRGEDLQVRVSAPTSGTDLPVVVFAHGFGLAMDSYDPLVDQWTAHGFVVIQPTFLDSATLALTPADPRYPDIWRSRVDDLSRVVDELDTIAAAVPGLSERVDLNRLALAGHSWGGQSVGMLLGARVIGADGETGPSARNPRIRAGVLLSTTGTGGADLTSFAQENFAFMSPDFTELKTPTLVVAGDADQSPLSTRGPDWFTDVYTLSPGATALLTLTGGQHTLGGIHGYRSVDTTDEDPARVALVAAASTAYLKQALGVDTAPWQQVQAELAAAAQPAGRIEAKRISR